MGSIAGAALGVGQLVSGVFGAVGASNAAGAQEEAFGKASALLKDYYTKGINYLDPYITGGKQAWGNLLNMTGNGDGSDPSKAPLTRMFQPTMAELEQTPGYQFALDQGLKATKNQLAARGLAGSGETLAGVNKFATGTASQTYQQQFENYLKQNQQVFGMLSNVAGAGMTSADAAARLGMSAGGGMASAAIGAGNAEAAGDLGMSKALGGMFSNLGQLPYTYLGMDKYLSGNGVPGNPYASNSANATAAMPYNPLAAFGMNY